ncbi:hypothetical protein MKW94_006820 [Papaver nudicaule]|uniref:Uncharacterized protein n=1 Tax=Papaver nudicaule TaxID=74823 RepID=A0AA41W2H0_PAPNU|nr:hypothetical protein [Papaver nudicaule]
MCDYFTELADVACQNDDKCSYIKNLIGETIKEITENGSCIQEENVSPKEKEGIVIRNPNEANTKGRPCTVRIKPTVEVSQEIPTQQSLVSTKQVGMDNLSREQYHQLSNGVPQVHTGEHLANGVFMLDHLPQISPYRRATNVAPVYGTLQHWENGSYTPQYGRFQ